MMKLWIAFISMLVRLAVWLKVHFRSILWKPQLEDTDCVLGQVDGSAPHRGEDQLVQGTVVVDASESTSLSSHDAPGFGLEAILSEISGDEALEFDVFYTSPGEVDKPRPYYSLTNVWKTIVRSVSQDRNLCINISRDSGTYQSWVVLSFSKFFVAEEEISVMFMEEFANAIRSNQRIQGVFIYCGLVREPDWPLATSFRTFEVNIVPVILENPSLRDVLLFSYGERALTLDRAAIENLVSSLCRNLTLTRFGIDNGWEDCFDTEGLKLFLKPLMIGGEGSYQGLRTLELNGIGINDERAQVVASMLLHNTSLTSISLQGNAIRPQGAACIAEALRSNTTLRQLDISDNPIDAAGLKALVASLTHNMADGEFQHNSSLTHLAIGGHIEDIEYIEDMELLGTLVRQNTSLVMLDLGQSRLLGVADNVIRLLEALKSNKCLEEVIIWGCDGVVGRRVLGTIFDLLEVNHHLKKLHLERTPLAKDGGADMVKAVLEQKAKHNMWEVLQAMATTRPNSARIFLCGYPYAGKTTLRQTIMKVVKPSDHNGMRRWKVKRTSTSLLTSMLRKGKSNDDPREVTPRTRGIEVHGMSFDDIMVTIWDMAGHDDYHSFHDLVIPNLTGNSGSSCSFLLVCNPLQRGTCGLKSVNVIGDELLYWLRFIASNSRISTAYKPHVIIVLTNHDMVGPDYESVTLPRIKDKVEWLRNLFQDILEIDLQVFAVNALSVDSINGLLQTMKAHLKILLGKLPHVFEACSRMQVLIANWNREHPNQPLVRWNEFSKFCDNVDELKSHEGLGPEVVERKKEVVAISLHDSGHLMYNEELDFVVLNPHWFCHDIIGRVLKCKELDNFDGVSNGTMTKVDFKHVVNASLQPNLQGFSFDDLLQMMIKLEFCYEHDDDTVLIPSLLQDDNDQSSLGKRQLHWPSQEKHSNWQYVGRRMLCSDKARTVLTLGFFPRLQVVFQKLFGRDNGKNSYKLAKNVISFYTSGMDVIVENSGQIGFDIDIMVRSSKGNKDVMLEFLHTQVMKPIHDLCAHPLLGCQGVKLVEGILRPTCVERLIPRIHTEHQVVLVEDLQSIVLATCDFSYEHNWKEDGPLQRGHDDAKSLLGKKAWENILNRHLQDLQKLQKVLPCDTKHEGLMATQPQWMDDGDDVMGEVRIADVQKLVQRVGRSLYHKIEESETNVVKRLDDMERRITIKLNHIVSMEKYMLPKICENIDKLMTFSVELQQSQVPRIVYFTTTPKKSLKRIVTRMVPGLTNLKIHFMCENRGGFHIVGDQKGCDVTFGTDATRVFQTILVWGLRIFTILAKVGAHLTAGMGSMIPDLAKDFMLVIDTPGLLDGWELPYVDETVDRNLQRLRIMNDDKRIAEQWLINFLKGKNLHSSFSLQKAMYKNSIGERDRSIAWLCNEHIKEGENDSTLVLLPC